MNVYEYWIGRDTDYVSVWQAYETGAGYIDKFRSMRMHVLRVELTQFAPNMALFNHDAVYKTLKGYFHDIKRYGLSESEYNAAGPLFLYGVDRGSGIWNFLGELEPLMALAMTLAEKMILNQELTSFHKRFQIVQRYFPTANPHDISRLMQANSKKDLQFALRKLTDQGIQGVMVSQEPFEGDFEKTEKTLIDIGNIVVGKIVFGDSVEGDKIQGNKITSGRDSNVAGRDVNVSKSHITSYDRARYGKSDLKILAHELYEIREMLHHGQAVEPEEDLAIGRIAAAELAARDGDKRATLLHLKMLGSWVFDFATKVGASVTAEFAKKAIGL